MIVQILALGSGADGLSRKKTRGTSCAQPFNPVMQAHSVPIRNLPVTSKGAHGIRQGNGSKTSIDFLRRDVPRADHHTSEFIAIFECSEPPRFVPDQWPTESAGVLFAPELRSLVCRSCETIGGIENRRSRLQRLIAFVK